MSQAFRLGLTGGIGSGKSTVAAMLTSMGAAVMDADAISRAVTAPNGAAIPMIRATFGAEYITADGAMDRDRMRALAYSDKSAKARLEGIIHPIVGQETWLLATQAQAAGHQCLVFDVPLLVESAHWRKKVDQVLVVDCLPDTQISRVMARNALTQEAIKAIIAAQASRERRLKAADAVIFNDGITLDGLRQLVHALATGFGLSSAHNPLHPLN